MLRISHGIPIALARPEVAGTRRTHDFAAGSPTVQHRRQQADNWCWAACVEMLEKAYTPASSRAQCAIVAQVLSRPDCCTSPDFVDCDCGAEIPQIDAAVKTVCKQAASLGGPLSENALRDAFKVHPAVMVGWRWDDTSASVSHHTILVTGVEGEEDEELRFLVCDPLSTGEDSLTFDELKDAQGKGKWIRTWINL